MKWILVFVGVGLGLILLLEVGLRIFLGLGNPPLYLADDKIGYLLAPNQRVRRFGNRIMINEFSQRNDFTPDQSNGAVRVLCLGDSIINGGWWTEQDRTIPALIEAQLWRQNFDVRVLNASANSWGPRNQLAYVSKFGVFKAQVVVLVLNTDDLFAIAPNSLPVGYDRNYPAQKPPLALIELIDYFRPKPPHPERDKVNAEKGDRVGLNLEAIEAIKAIALEHNSQLILAMTPLLRELSATGPRNYEQKARQRLKEFTQQEQIPYLDFLPIFAQQPQPENLFRDHIHLSPQGNQIVSEKISNYLKQKLP